MSSPHFEAFRWTRPESDELQVDARHLNRLIGQVIDVTHGVRVLLELMEQDEMALVDDEPTVLDPVNTGALRRLGVVSLQMLNNEASRLCEWVEASADRTASDAG
ncbi:MULTISPECIES: hypothetical protein [unclassified Rhizobacter]|uniref:hypothetical protein n=1 Tax=unclassified Rhizobacter TaxID=2640088 RepID=UPI0006F291DB|nr:MULTISPECIES: hypothetical protein [unclassified Rhizobacter]KQU75503.1 hypothetical protein ASC88_24330 [Rhizobacter sp. Root29]KQW06922.1 hypothetical protein ASC98_26130 [Rhizobacter sp. Root1238]KRB18959.1 hypothetical protein ASE08_07075 [Rhizobacter sp. Root16D2]